MIVVDNLCKQFGAVQALDGVSFSALDGRITGLLGANGAGKSTTLRIISAVVRGDSGSARVDGLDCAGDAIGVRRQLGVLPHACGVYPNLTARENIHYFAELNGLTRAQCEERIERWCAQLQMGEFIDRRAKGFSHGQKLKVALARALIHAPRNVILDEPTSGLDVAGTRALRDVIRSLRDQGCCVLISSHIMQEVSALCDDVVIIAHGRVVMTGAPSDIVAQVGGRDLEEAFMRVSSLMGSDGASA